MRARLFSSVTATQRGPRLTHRGRWLSGCLTALVVATASSGPAVAQQRSGYYTDPETGYVYRKVTRTVERPVTETRMQTREKTVYRPQTVTETRPETRTVYTPVVEYRWVPKWEGRWNPFRQPTLAYEYEPQTHWEARTETVRRTTTRTQWVAEKRRETVPQRITRIERERETDYELVGRVAPRSEADSSSGNASAIASRLRPLENDQRIAPIGAPSEPTLVGSASRLASRRSSSSAQRGGLPANDLTGRSPSSHHQPLPPAGSGIANLPAPPLWR